MEVRPALSADEYPKAVNSAEHPCVTLVTTAASVSFLQGAAEHTDVSQLFTGSIMLVLALRNNGSNEFGDRQADASGFEVSPVKVFRHSVERLQGKVQGFSLRQT